MYHTFFARITHRNRSKIETFAHNLTLAGDRIDAQQRTQISRVPKVCLEELSRHHWHHMAGIHS